MAPATSICAACMTKTFCSPVPQAAAILARLLMKSAATSIMTATSYLYARLSLSQSVPKGRVQRCSACSLHCGQPTALPIRRQCMPAAFRREIFAYASPFASRPDLRQTGCLWHRWSCLEAATQTPSICGRLAASSGSCCSESAESDQLPLPICMSPPSSLCMAFPQPPRAGERHPIC